MTTCLEAAAEAIAAYNGDSNYPVGWQQDEAQLALDAIDPRLKLLTPEDVTGILDYLSAKPKYGMRLLGRWDRIPAHVWEVLGR